MKGTRSRIALIAILFLLGCNSAQAVTYFDSNCNTRPDGVGDTAQNASVSLAPTEDGGQVVYGSASDSDGIGDYYDSGD